VGHEVDLCHGPAKTKLGQAVSDVAPHSRRSPPAAAPRGLASRPSTLCPPHPSPPLIRQAPRGTRAALAAGHDLIEVEFPPSGLRSVPGDGEGANEMTANAGFLRSYAAMFNRDATSTAVFFPDAKEMALAMQGSTADGGLGFNVPLAPVQRPAEDLAPSFSPETSRFRLSYLTSPSGLGDMGIDLAGLVAKAKGGDASAAGRLRTTDGVVLAAYPSFQVQEMLELRGIHAALRERSSGPADPLAPPLADTRSGAVGTVDRPATICFNGELERYRGGYYPKLFYPKVAKMSEEWIPAFTPAYIYRNVKGSRGGCLLYVAGDLWRVFARPMPGCDPSEMVQVWEGETRPTLKEVALDLLPRFGRGG